jgi:N-methylhydantoinase A
VIEARVVRPLGLSLTEAAWGIHRVVNENMAAAARIHGIEHGRDLRQQLLLAFGGAGPVHAWQVGRILKVPRVLVPLGAGAISAWSLLVAPLAFDFVRTAPQRLDEADWSGITRLFTEMEAEGREILRAAGAADHHMTLRRSAEMRYVGQGHEVVVEVPADALGPPCLDTLTRGFEAAYRALYSRTPRGVSPEALNWRLVISGPTPQLSMTGQPPLAGDWGSAAATSGPPQMVESRAERLVQNPGTAGAKNRRPAYFPEAGGYVETPVYNRHALRAGIRLSSPAIIEERESTTVGGPGARISVDPRLNLLAEPAP